MPDRLALLLATNRFASATVNITHREGKPTFNPYFENLGL
jgi:hypothetical protein